jgi:hypothetical protein
LIKAGVGRVALLPEIIRRAVKVRIAGSVPFRLRAARQLPSVSLYFADPLAHLIGSVEDHAERPICRHSRTLYSCGESAIVIRYAGPREIRAIRAMKPAKVYFVVDDDFFALADDDGLPGDYRRRLIDYREGPLRSLLDLVTHVVAPSPHILARYRQRALLLEPAQCHRAGALAHHDRARPFDVVFAATRSHLGDLAHVAPALAEFLRQRPEARLTTFLNGYAPKSLRNLHNAIHLPVMEWTRYRSFVAENRFHAAIAPALDTPFNRARSISRLHDHAAFGAAGLYSRQPPFATVVSDGESGMLLSNEPGQWCAALLNLATRRELTRRLAMGGQALSGLLGDHARVRSFWKKELGLS